jgi:hypothetical protein
MDGMDEYKKLNKPGKIEFELLRLIFLPFLIFDEKSQIGKTREIK